MPRARLLLLGLLALTLLPSLAVPARPTYAATIAVTTTADEAPQARSSIVTTTLNLSNIDPS